MMDSLETFGCIVDSLETPLKHHAAISEQLKCGHCHKRDALLNQRKVLNF